MTVRFRTTGTAFGARQLSEGRAVLLLYVCGDAAARRHLNTALCSLGGEAEMCRKACLLPLLHCVSRDSIDSSTN